jgi:hypothetical protein
MVAEVSVHGHMASVLGQNIMKPVAEKCSSSHGRQEAETFVN